MSCITVAHLYRARRYPAHSHNEYQMIYVAAGCVSLNVAGHSYEVSAPAVMFLGNLETHSFSSVTDEYERYTVTIPPQIAAGMLDETLLAVFLPHGNSTRSVIPVPQESVAEMQAFFSVLEKESHEEGFPDVQEMLVRMILIRLYRISPASFPCAHGGMAQTVSEVRRLLETDLGEKMTLQDLGERFHVSVFHLERVFHAQTGYSIARYRLLSRIAAARELLAVSKDPVGEIAYRVGIGDVSNFSRYFRRETGMSPLEYRKRYSAPEIPTDSAKV